MNQQSGFDGIVVVGDEISNPFYTELSSGEFLLIACERGWSEQQSERAYTVRIAEILRLIDNGQFQKPPADGSLWENYGRITTPTKGTDLSLEVVRGSARRPRGLDDSPASSSSCCPTLASDASSGHELSPSHANRPSLQIPLRPLVDSSITSAPNSTESSVLLSTREEELEPLVLASARQLSNATFWASANDAAPSVTRPSADKPAPQSRPRSSPSVLEVWKACRATSAAPAFFNATTLHPTVSATILTLANVSDSPRQVSPSQSSQDKSGKSQSRKHRVQKSSKSKPKKKARLPDDGDNQSDGGNGGSGSGSGGGGAAPAGPDGRNKSDIRWACPYCLAFTHMLDIVKFKSCRPPGSLNSRSLWKDHLKEYHSPEARLSNPNAAHSSFYMDDDQWTRVKLRIAEKTTRPRQYDEWFEAQKTCFLEVWRIIFPKALYPSLNEPLSPFHPDSTNLVANLGSGIRILLGAIRETWAERAVNTGAIATIQDFHPTEEQYNEMMVEVLTTITKASPSASQWVANVSPAGLQAAALDHDQATQQAEAEIPDFKAVISPEPTPGSGSEESTPVDNPTDLTVPVVPAVLPLSPKGTQIYFEVSPNHAIEPSQRPAFLEVHIPQGFHINNMNMTSVPAPPSTIAVDPSITAPPLAPTSSSIAEPASNHHQAPDPNLHLWQNINY
ncbi:hypothetical protein F4803DRAFT_572268 [Xylaria telfairii]|nr:hypothetical protein F4803DRAFT_572268 [Xylaria telfairii]